VWRLLGAHMGASKWYSVGTGTRGEYPSYINGKQTPSYVIWGGMLKRCYDPKYLAKQPTYVDCTVVEDFKNFQYFAKWCDNQVGFGNKGWQLDKDILVKGNKLYSEDNCAFVPREINGLVVRCNAKRGVYPIGVSFDKQTGRYLSQCRGVGNARHVGRFDTIGEAFSAYKVAKELEVKRVAKLFKGLIDDRVYNKLVEWEVDFND